MNILMRVKMILDKIFLLLIYSSIVICETVNKSNDINLYSVDLFPHNIDKDFILNVRHSEIEYHHLYAVFILHVKCPIMSESQKLFIYPGFTKKLDHRLKETLFHIMHFETRRFQTTIVLRFYRESSDCNFIVEYSAIGAENIHLKLPKNIVSVYSTKILLFRPATLKLSITAEDGHQGGLSIGKKGLILCHASDGFPFIEPVLSPEKDLHSVPGPRISKDSALMYVVGASGDHGKLVTCTCGSVSVSTRLRVFHHALSVQVLPDGQQRFRQGSKLQCSSHGGGYPIPLVRWAVLGLNDTTRHWFTVSSLSDSLSVLTIEAGAPNNTKWSLNCSSVNIIPPMDRGGPSIWLNITIGDNVAGSIMLSNYLWIIGVFVIIVIVCLAIGVVCLSSRVGMCRRRKSVAKEVPQAPLQQYSSLMQSDTFDSHPPPMNKAHECNV